MTEVVKVTDAGHVRTIRLNRPERKNALSDELAWGVVAAIDEAARADDVWVIAITGSGDAFCAGLDLTGSPRASPLSPQSAQLDDVGWVGNFLLAIASAATSRWSAGSTAWRWGRASAWPWLPTYA